MHRHHSHRCILLLIGGCLLFAPSMPCSAQAPGNLVRGRPYPLIDRTGWILGIPNKVALWSRKADNHAVSPASEQSVQKYVESKQLSSTLIRVNQYDPLGEWRRLTTNHHVAAPWRYAIGTLHVLRYTVAPGRLIGGDYYNPYTDTLNIYSDIPALGLVEAAYADDIRHRIYPGAYAAVQDVPLLGMWHKTLATKQVLRHYQQFEPFDDATRVERTEAQRILFSDYGGSWGSQLGTFVPYGHAFGRIAGAAVGHVGHGVRSLFTKPHPAESVESSYPLNDAELTFDGNTPAAPPSGVVQATHDSLR